MALPWEEVDRVARLGALDHGTVLRIARDSGGAFAEIVRRYEGQLTRFLTGVLDDDELVAEVLQPTFLELRLALALDRTEVALPAWLYRAATRNALDAQRRTGRERLRLLAAPVTPAPRDPTDDVTDRFAARRALVPLSTEDRICILLSAVVGMRYGEVAQVLGIEATAARQQIARARARFRIAYEREAPPLDPGARR